MSGKTKTFTAADVSIAIPTFGRDQVLVDTIEYCLRQPRPAGELIIVDQTPQHEYAVQTKLEEYAKSGAIRWEKQATPSQPGAMNVALRLATRPLILFLDDDVVPAEGFVEAHARAHQGEEIWAVVGQIVQPWQQPEDIEGPALVPGLRADFDFPFHSRRTRFIHNLMSGHVSVRRERALEIGGFDENFRGAAYRFDTEFGRRILVRGGKILFCPDASLRHLRVARGGTRKSGSHLTSASPHHGVGDYYFALLHGGQEAPRYIAHRMIREVCTRFHLRHPWWIPVKFVGEVRALRWAARLRRQGPALLRSESAPAI